MNYSKIIKQIPYIFFDIDGVLNKESDWKKFRFSINSESLKVFKSFADFLSQRYGTSSKLITCSTWRAGLNNKGEDSSDSGSILEKALSSVNLHLDGITPVSTKTRQEEIEYFIRRNNITSYIIIDDDPSLYPRPNDINLYVPDYKTGLISKDLKKLEKQFIKFGG